MEGESEPYVRLGSLRHLHQNMADLSTARSLADTLQAVADGVLAGLGYELVSVHLVLPDGDLVVAAVVGGDGADELRLGRVTSRDSWESRLQMGEAWGDLRFVLCTEGRFLQGDDLPQYSGASSQRSEDSWQPGDRLFAPMHTPGASRGELIGVLYVDRPGNERRPGAWGREALQMYAFQAAIAISNARLRANMQRALVRLEQEQQALRASEESFRQAFEYAPSGMAMAEMGGEHHGRILRTNDALCRLLGRPATSMRHFAFSNIVHPQDISTFYTTSAEGGQAELRLARRDGSYVWVSLRHSVVADAADGPRFLLTHVEDVEERKHREQQLAHLASHDSLTGLPNSAELRERLEGRICGDPHRASPDRHHVHMVAPMGGEREDDLGKGLAVLFCDLDGMQSINDLFGYSTGDAVLVEVGRRLANALREGDTAARLGGDEFVVLADGLSPSMRRELVEHLRRAITSPIRVAGRTVRVEASFGTAWAACGTSAAEVLQTADQRMYVEKRTRATAHQREPERVLVPERRSVDSLPDRTVGPWAVHRPAAQRQHVRTWPTKETAISAPRRVVQINSRDEFFGLAHASHIHRVVCRGDIADLSPLRRLPALRSLAIADNAALSYLDDLEGCERLRFLTVSGCASLRDWAGAASTGAVFIEVGPEQAVASLAGLVESRWLRELTLLGSRPGGDTDLAELRRSLPGVRVRLRVEESTTG